MSDNMQIKVTLIYQLL